MYLIHTLKELLNLPTYFYLFSYGSNNLRILTRKLSMEDDERYSVLLDRNTEGYILRDHLRTFFGSSDVRGNGGGGSIGNIRYNRGTYVEGLRTLIYRIDDRFYVEDMEIDFKSLASSEKLDESDPMKSVYILKHVDDYTYSFVRNDFNKDNDDYHEVSKKYLDLIKETILDSRRKRGDGNQEVTIIRYNDKYFKS